MDISAPAIDPQASARNLMRHAVLSRHVSTAQTDASCNCLGLLCDVPHVAQDKPCIVHAGTGSWGLSVVQAPGAHCNDQGFFQLPTTTKALVLSLPNFTLATAAADSQTVAEGAAAQTEGLQWVCRSKIAALHVA